ncbi:N-terminal domain of galactosyltransferase [Psychroflexus salarius]|uniref:N-terminal domain of galactosyltransferase n=1 Tax=Psychroflexus salarius TaxID=1155689 RepID=A0A1M4Y011_9FLAO|nr:glycosyltransferase family 2 protein [Psychroflexus salarius]SHE98926.1 N-terminal domain of galactosyltransferase [Psychroflexus salarius]
MSNVTKSSLITPTYNWPEALELLLLSVLNQNQLPDEVIVADDGSTNDTKRLVEKFQKNFPVPLHHIWHEDKGNRKPRIMNKAIAKAKYPYIIEIDGDIIMHKNFVKDHLNFAKKGLYLYGSRANIQEEYLEELIKKKQIHFNYFSKGIKKRGRTLHLPALTNIYKPVDQRSRKLRGCNMSFWRKDFIKVNGFNENLVGWGIDDSEMIQRLHNIGIKGKRLKFSGIAYHIYHKEQSKSHIDINREIEEQTTEKKLTYCEKGVDQFLK